MGQGYRKWRVNTEGIKSTGTEIGGLFALLAVFAGGAGLVQTKIIAGWMDDAGVSLEGMDLTPVERKNLDMGKIESLGPYKVAVEDGDLRYVFDFEARTVVTEYRVVGERSFDELEGQRGQELLETLIKAGCAGLQESAPFPQAMCTPALP